MAEKKQSNNRATEKKKSKTAEQSNIRKNKAEQASAKSIEDIQVEQNRELLIRLLCSGAIAVVGFLQFLSFIGIHGVLLDVLKNGICGLFGAGFYLFWLACLFSAFLISVRYSRNSIWRCIASFIIMFSFGALIHLTKEPIVIPTDSDLISHLWNSGMNFGSGGVLAGGFAHGMMLLVSKPGTTVLLLILLFVGIVYTFKVPVRRMIHTKAEEKHQKIEEVRKTIPQPEPIAAIHTVNDIRVLTTPIPVARGTRIQQRAELKARKRDRNPKDFDVPIDDAPVEQKTKAKKATPSMPQATSFGNSNSDDLLFTKKKKAQKVMRVQPRTAAKTFDIPMDDDFVVGAYTVAVQNVVKAESEILTDVPAILETIEVEQLEINDDVETEEEKKTAPSHQPVQLTQEQIEQGIIEAEATKTLKPGEADAEEEEIYRDISQASERKPTKYQYPTTSFLKTGDTSSDDHSEETRRNIQLLEETLSSFGVDIKVSGKPVRGPSVTRYEMKLPLGTKMSKITSLAEDLALSLGVASVRIAAVTGKTSTIGIEVPNTVSTSVPIGSILQSTTFKTAKSKLAFAVGKDISGEVIVGDIAKMPHLLIAGTTGSGKSVCMNSIIVSMLYHASPEQVRMIMIDPKVVELSIYNGIPHLLIPVVTDPKKAAGALQWAVTEMERRYNLLAEYNVRDLAGFNKQAANTGMEPLPQIVVIIDELADLMMVAAKDIENSIVRIAQKARAAGMHLIIATQRPSANVITGLMKSNIPSRIAFAVSSAVDSRIILDVGGAEKLLGKGDMLYAPIGSGNPKRIQGCFIDDEEVEAVVNEVRQVAETNYDDSIAQQIDQNAAAATTVSGGVAGGDDAPTTIAYEGDELLPDAVEVVLDTKQASVSMLQRRLRLGYAHAARIVDEMEEKGIVGPFEGSKPRQLLITREQWEHMVGINPKATPVGSTVVEETAALCEAAE